MDIKTIELLDKKLTELTNKRGEFMVNPDRMKTIEKNGQGYYNAHQIDTLDEQLWLSWRKFIENLKTSPNNNYIH